MAISTAVSLQRVSSITGYEIKASQAGLGVTFLPQNVGIIAEGSHANQGTLPDKISFTSAKEVGVITGFNCPAYAAARILRPLSGDKLGGIPTTIYIVKEAAGATATVITKSITGTATKNATHSLIVNGRGQLDGTVYSYAVAKDDTKTEIAQKMADALNNVLGAPATGSVDGTDQFVATSGWYGVSSAELDIQIDVDGDSAGITYAEVSKVDGAGLPSTTDALAQIGTEWVDHLVNCVGSDSDTLDALELFIGNANDRTGRYEAVDFKPAVAYFGDNSRWLYDDATNGIKQITDGRKLEMANVFCPAPKSKGFSFEAAANMAFLYAPLVQDSPNADPVGLYYNDMPVGVNAGDFEDSAKRDLIVKAGGSTVTQESEKYKIVDLVTTYHPDDEVQTAMLFRWVRDLVGLDWNCRYVYMINEEIYVKGKTIVPDTSTTTNNNTISPKRWKSILISQFGPVLVQEALMADLAEFVSSLEVQIGDSNPNRFETAFGFQRTGVARVLSTTNNTTFKFNS